ncbi:MAG: M1 family metallopeptidase [Cyclobacteriaceae bacterium]|nr:M1 family metallopeptidase [Cyclobacteriaceae bacterium]
MLKTISVLIIFLLAPPPLFATDSYPKNSNIDIQHYRFGIDLNDSTNTITGGTEVTILFKNSVSNFELDLIGKTPDGNGMVVSSVTQGKTPLQFSHKNNRLSITLQRSAQMGEEITLSINYKGIPSDGLVISTNKFGDRTFFGDNWPNRAHYWLPTIDHPYDKASCEFIVIAPSHYQAIANGILVEKTNLPNNRILTHWKEDMDIPTKVMVIGVARFAITTAGLIKNIPVETWVYPQNKEAGFIDYKIATTVLQYFIDHVGPYPYQKLANVQSTTRYGGMENASNIFYYENSVTGKNESEGLIAHEIAHQWFGDSASEMDWYHVWLSEGFATYFTNLYYEATYGKVELASRMADQRTEVVKYYIKNPAPVIDTTLMDINRVLNTNSYQKGSWVLHMLRKVVGDEIFWRGIREYYQTYQNSNALTSDFRHIMEKVSGKDLKSFFDQWLRRSGHPVLSATWHYNAKKKQIELTVGQKQKIKFITPLEIGIKAGDGSIEVQTLQLSGEETKFSLAVEKSPQELILDPYTWLLFEGEISRK